MNHARPLMEGSIRLINLNITCNELLHSHFLQEELQELKEQVMMYESVSQLGIHPLGNSGGSTQLGGATYNAAGVAADDSYSQLGIKSNKGAARDEPGSNSSTPRSYV